MIIIVGIVKAIKMCCICISDDPVEDSTGRIKVYLQGVPFRTTMMHAPCTSFTSFLYCLGQFIPCTMGITQYMLRRKVLEGDMGRYSCGQGYFDCLCFKAGNCCESSCPHVCAFLEGCFCNCIAVSASRMYIQDQFDLTSDKCDYRLIRIVSNILIIIILINYYNYDQEQLPSAFQLYLWCSRNFR